MKKKESVWPNNLIYELYGDVIEIDIDSSNFEAVLEMMMKLLETLTEKEADLIILRYKNNMVFRDIGDFFGVCHERARQIMFRAIRKLRHPSRALRMYELIAPIYYKKCYEEQVKKKNEERLRKEEEIKATKIDKIDISNRSKNALKRNGIVTIKDLIECTEMDIRNIYGIGDRSLGEIKLVLSKYGYELKI